MLCLVVGGVGFEAQGSAVLKKPASEPIQTVCSLLHNPKWEFPKIRGPLFWGVLIMRILGGTILPSVCAEIHHFPDRFDSMSLSKISSTHSNKVLIKSTGIYWFNFIVFR